MTVERTFYCDGPGCERHTRTMEETPHTFNTVIWRAPRRVTELHFCGWDCILRYAGTIEPETVIPMFDSDDAS